jgi:ATP-dependent exoDNAse (exonuclease V) alpha subunit
VAQLNERARADRLAATGRPAREVMLSDTTHVSAGDVIFTRYNDRRLVVSDTDWVKDEDRWRVADVGRDGSLTVTPSGRGLGRRIVLPASYIADHVRLGYATSIRSAQGLTVETTHVVLSGAESRQCCSDPWTIGEPDPPRRRCS